MFEYYQCPVIKTCPPRRKKFIEPTNAPYPEITNTPHSSTPYPETPRPTTPIPATPYPGTPITRTPYPETPYPGTPYPETPIPCSCKYSETVSIPGGSRRGNRTVVNDYISHDPKICCNKGNYTGFCNCPI